MSKNITKEQAIEMGDAILRESETSRAEWFAEMYRTGKYEKNMYKEYIYSLYQIGETESEWFLTYWLEGTGGVVVEPPFVYISVDKITGERSFPNPF